MITLTPGSAPVDISHVMDVLTLAADPVGTKARLVELQELLDKTNFSIEQANSLQSDATQRMAVNEASAAYLAKDKDAFSALTKEVADRQSAADSALVARKIDLDKRESDFETLTTSTMVTREKNVAQREADVSAREAALAAAGDQAASLKAEYEAKLAKLRDIMGEK